MESKHTSGPWEVKPECFRGRIYCEPTIDAGVKDGEPRTVATIRVGLAGTDANANLIAAAPELLEALRGMVEAWEKPLDDEKARVAAARAAIAKATR